MQAIVVIKKECPFRYPSKESWDSGARYCVVNKCMLWDELDKDNGECCLRQFFCQNKGSGIVIDN